MLKVTCDGCGASYQAPEKLAGRKIRCKKCEGVVSIPAVDPGEGPSRLDEPVVMDASARQAEVRSRSPTKAFEGCFFALLLECSARISWTNSFPSSAM